MCNSALLIYQNLFQKKRSHLDFFFFRYKKAFFLFFKHKMKTVEWQFSYAYSKQCRLIYFVYQTIAAALDTMSLSCKENNFGTYFRFLNTYKNVIHKFIKWKFFLFIIYFNFNQIQLLQYWF